MQLKKVIHIATLHITDVQMQQPKTRYGAFQVLQALK